MGLKNRCSVCGLLKGGKLAPERVTPIVHLRTKDSRASYFQDGNMVFDCTTYIFLTDLHAENVPQTLRHDSVSLGTSSWTLQQVLSSQCNAH